MKCAHVNMLISVQNDNVQRAASRHGGLMLLHLQLSQAVLKIWHQHCQIERKTKLQNGNAFLVFSTI